MKRLLLSGALLGALCFHVNAGVIDGNPVVPPTPPACTENCNNATTLSIAESVKLQIALLLAKLITR